MEDSFRVRVDKIFGSLASSSSSSLRSLWSLSDDEVERREWNRERDSPDREEIPCSSSFDGFFSKERKFSEKISRNLHKNLEGDLEDLYDHNKEQDEQSRGSLSQFLDRNEHEKEEWEIISSIGLDCTLDNEEEEDEHDKVALDRENAGDRLYMKDAADYEIYLDSDNVLPNSFNDFTRDPRANHLAARIRLKEDKEAAGSFDSSLTSDNIRPAVVGPQVKKTENGGNPKSILKRKENQTDTKPQKRVRFDPGCKCDCKEELEEAQDSIMISYSVAEDSSPLPQDAPGVPDYIRNPSKYIRYSFNSVSEVDEESNRKAYMDFLNVMKRSNTVESQPEGTSADLLKSVTFTPKRKSGDATEMNSSSESKRNQKDACKESLHRAGFPLSIAAGDAKENETCAVEEDEPETTSADKCGSSRKLGRHYRTKNKLDDSVS